MKLSFASATSVEESPFEFSVQREHSLWRLGEKYAPTKARHGYLDYYWMHLRDVREQVQSVLEIGVQAGNSLRMWEEFFPNATVCGVDIDPACMALAGGRRRIIVGDQSDPLFLRQLVTEAAPFDVIIDDGSHVPRHQLQTFEALFPALSSHGIYVIEDTGGCVGDNELVTVAALKHVINSVMYWPGNVTTEQWPLTKRFDEGAKWLDRNTVGIAFYRWMIVVMRGRNPEDEERFSRSQR